MPGLQVEQAIAAHSAHSSDPHFRLGGCRPPAAREPLVREERRHPLRRRCVIVSTLTYVAPREMHRSLANPTSAGEREVTAAHHCLG